MLVQEPESFTHPLCVSALFCVVIMITLCAAYKSVIWVSAAEVRFGNWGIAASFFWSPSYVGSLMAIVLRDPEQRCHRLDIKVGATDAHASSVSARRYWE